jgi:Zn-dependent protease with chaperone function
VGRPPNEATVVVTSELLSLLDTSEQEAALAYQLAQLESGEVQAVARADAVADSVEAFSFLKGRVFWSPKDILQYGLPFYLVFGLLLVAIAIVPQQPVSGEIDFGGFLLILLCIAGGLGLLALMAASAFWSLPALFQLFLLVTFVGPLTLIEMALALPTALALTRLISRTRIDAGDRRSVELTGDRTALVSALEKLDAAAPLREPGEAEPFWDAEGIESFWGLDRTRMPPNHAWLGYPRFALFVAPRARRGFRAWLSRFYTTHPPISSRIEALNADRAQDGSRPSPRSTGGRDRSAQSG